MIRKAKLYFLENKNWQLLASEVNNHTNFRLKNYITIFQFPHVNDTSDNYSVISLSDETDQMIERLGGYELSTDDRLRNTLHEYFGDPIYGNKLNLTYLDKAC